MTAISPACGRGSRISKSRLRRSSPCPTRSLEETGDFALSIPVTLTHYGGAVSIARAASLGRLPQSPRTSLQGSFSDSGLVLLVRAAGKHGAGRIPDGKLDPLAGAGHRSKKRARRWRQSATAPSATC